jgi:flavin reductase (DIM6/NTAB) family NADH-FMN oxidoreductase RutF
MAVGSFTSVSLDPPLVAFFPDKTSTTWPRIERAGSFCVNVLGQDQLHVCRAFAAKGGDKFGELRWQTATSGAPIIEEAIAWIDCDIEQVHEAGDHYIVVGRVRELDVVGSSLPLLFFQGGYGRFVPESLVTGDLDVIEHFRKVDVVRHELEELARDADVECNLAVRVRDDLVILATAGQPRGGNIPTRVGHRYAAIPPVACVHAAWDPDDAVDAWLKRAPELTPAARDAQIAQLAWIRAHGYALLLGRYRSNGGNGDPPGISHRDIRRHIYDLHVSSGPDELAEGADNRWALLSAPSFDAAGRVSLVLNLYGFDGNVSATEALAQAERLRDASVRVTELIGGRAPDEGAAPA